MMPQSLPTNLDLFPISTTLNSNNQLAIAGHSLTDLVKNFGTPLYFYDGFTIRHQVKALQTAFVKHYPGDSLIAYAGKAYFSLGMATELAKLGVGSDVVSLGEIRVAQRAGFSPEGVHLHGNNKTQAELEAALDWGIQAIVVDNLDELDFLEELAKKKGITARIWLRITPDLDVNTHPHIETSHSASKFGLHITNGQAAKAIRKAKSSKWFNLVGIHTHLGSQLFDAAPYQKAIEMLYALAENENFIPAELSPGGGWGVRYNESDPSDAPEPWVETVSKTVVKECTRLGWPLPRLVLEPGRWIVARAGVALYQIGTQKDTPDGTHIVAVDGGMADNPRMALYGAQYTGIIANRPLDTLEVESKVVGKFCESGDVLINSVLLPSVKRGDVLAIPASGAYQLSMSSNYNFAVRPAVLWLEPEEVRMIQCCEKPEKSAWWTGSKQ
jgi:diaminopimelate decarboxylase